MDGNKKINTVLFALTGFGNTVLKALLKNSRVNVKAVFTVKYEKPCPYYEEQQLIDLCKERDVLCYHGISVNSAEGISLLQKLFPDLILVSTFKQILKENVLDIPPLGVINFHPSLLPQYRGPCPTNAALFHDERVTGITVHYVTQEVDQGSILLTRPMAIDDICNDGQLRRELAILAGNMVPEVIELFRDHIKPLGAPQEKSISRPAPRPTVEDGYLELAGDVDTIRRKLRAYNPLPGTSILIGERRIPVDRFELFQDSRPDGVHEGQSTIDLIVGSRGIRLKKKSD
jgi:methionyl-tRNA formyltransferase